MHIYVIAHVYCLHNGYAKTAAIIRLNYHINIFFNLVMINCALQIYSFEVLSDSIFLNSFPIAFGMERKKSKNLEEKDMGA